MTRPILAEYAQHGWHLCHIDRGLKSPFAKGWNTRERAFTDPDVAAELDGNVGLMHAYSGTCALDLDDLVTATGWLAERGIHVDALLSAPDAVMVSSGRENRAKLLYRLATPLPSFRLNGFELRCATSKGTTVQDTLPPSVHPETQQEYVWKYAEDAIGHWSNLPEIPHEVLVLWQSLVTPETKVRPERPEGLKLSGKKLGALLEGHNPDSGYDDWLRVGMALHHETQGGDDGFAAWDDWSACGTKYKGVADLQNHWRSFNANTKNPVTAASLRKDLPADPMEFDIVPEGEAEASEAAQTSPKAVARQRLKDVPATMAEAVERIPRDKGGKALAVLPSVVTVLSVPQVTNQQVSFDTFKDQIMLAPIGTHGWRPFRDVDYTAFRIWLENAINFYPVGKDLVRDAIHYIAEVNKMDTAQKWLTDLEWDGVPRIERFLPQYMGTIDTPYERSVSLYLWTALAGRIMEPGCQVDMVPVLVGPQGLGKSQGIKAIVPDPDFYVEVRLDEPDDAIARKMRGTLIGEMAELRGLRTADQDRILAFVTRTHEKWTPKWNEYSANFARRLVMVGTTNEDDFLVAVENRRWLPVRTAGVSVEAIAEDRDQLWAEALQMWMEHGVRWRQAEVLGKDQHDEYRNEDNWQPIIADWLKEHETKQFPLAECLVGAIGLDLRTVGRPQELRVARILRLLGYDKKVIRDASGKAGKIWMPNKTPGLQAGDRV